MLDFYQNLFIMQVLKKTFAIVAIVILTYIPYLCDAAEAWKIISSTPKGMF